MRDDGYAYLFHLLVWGLPVLVLQLGLLFAHAGPARARRVLVAVVPPALGASAWLTVADLLAIDAGIWRFGEAKLLGVELWKVPVEELLFFVLSNLLIALGLALFCELRPRRRTA